MSETITVLIDTSEQKTPRFIEEWIVSHPKNAKLVTFINKSLKVLGKDRHELGDMVGNHQLFQLKWGQDLYSSLNQKEAESSNNPNPRYHLEAQLQRMRDYMTQHNLVVGHLVCADSTAFVMNLELFKRATSLCQEAGIWIHHRGNSVTTKNGISTFRNGITMGVECVMDLILHPKHVCRHFFSNQDLYNKVK